MSRLTEIKGRIFYGWVMVASFLLIGTIIFGTRYSFGVFFKSIESGFVLTREATSSIYSVYMVITAVFSLLGGWALDKYGPKTLFLMMGVFSGLGLILASQARSVWQLYLTYSLLMGIGTGPAYTVIMATISRWFHKRRGLALGIAGIGGGLGATLLPPFTAYLIANLSLSWAFMILGLIAGLVIVSLSRLLKRDPYQVGALPYGMKASSSGASMADSKGHTESVSHSFLKTFREVKVFRTRSFWCFLFTWLVHAFSLHLVLTHLVPHATDQGISDIDAAFVFALFGFVSIGSRLIMGPLSDRVGRKVTAIGSAVPHVLAMLGLIWAQELWMFYLFAVVYGLFYGGLDAPITALVGDTFGMKNIGAVLGTLGVTWGIGAAVGPWLAGRIFDTTGGYSLAFLLGAIAMAVAALLLSFVRREEVEIKQKEKA